MAIEVCGFSILGGYVICVYSCIYISVFVCVCKMCVYLYIDKAYV